MNICFDIDGCLINEKGKAIEENCELMLKLCNSHKVYLWSGNGFDYAYKIAKEWNLLHKISGVLDKYNTFKPDIAFDNQEIDLGKLNIVI